MDNANKYEMQYISILSDLHMRPGLYIGCPSLEKLFGFMAGYEVAVYQLSGYRITINNRLYSYICKKLMKCEQESSLYQLIRDGRSDEEGFDYYFHEFNLYREESIRGRFSD